MVEVGEPFYAHPDFDLEARLKEVQVAQAAEIDHTHSNTSAGTPDVMPVVDPDEPSLLPQNTPVPATSENLDQLFEQAIRPAMHGPASAPDAIIPQAAAPRSSSGEHAFRNTANDSQVADLSPSTPADSAQIPPAAGVSNAVAHKRKHGKARRRAQREKEAALTPGSKAFKKASLKYLQNASAMQTKAAVAATFTHDIHTAPPSSTPIHTNCSLDRADVPVTANGFIAKLYDQTDEDRRAIPVQELRHLEGWQYIQWSGRTCHALLDRRGFVIGELCGQPKWGDINEPLMKIFDATRSTYSFSADERETRRGNFPSIATGISFGGGQKRVGNLAHSPHNQAVWNALKKLVPIKRVANFANYSFRSFFPDVHKFYATTLDSLCAKDATLQRNFPNNAFAAMSLNLGPQSISYVHTDHLNLAHGLCAITAIGDYDPVAGGHLVLWDLQMVIEFPPGSTIIIPSAILLHSNTALGSEHERRYALVQYSAGGLFRWVECDYQTQDDFFAAGRDFVQTGKQRWERGVAMFSKWDDIKNRFKHA